MSRERLAKLLGMLGSDFDGERANAASMIAKMAKEQKRSIADLVMGGNRYVPPQIVYRDRVVEKIVYRDRVVEKIVYRDRPGSHKRMADREDEELLDSFIRSARARQTCPLITDLIWAAAFPEHMTAWEIDFCENILRRYRHEDDMTDRQVISARRIIARVKAAMGESEPLI